MAGLIHHTFCGIGHSFVFMLCYLTFHVAKWLTGPTRNLHARIYNCRICASLTPFIASAALLVAVLEKFG